MMLITSMLRTTAAVIPVATNKTSSSNVSFAKAIEKGRQAEDLKATILALEAKLKPKRKLVRTTFINVDEFAAGKRALDRNMLTVNDMPIRTVHCRKASPYTMADVQYESAKRGVQLVQEKIVIGSLVKYGLVSYASFNEYKQNNRITSVRPVYEVIPPEVTGEAAKQLGKEIDTKQARDFCGTATKNLSFGFAKFQFERSNPSELMELT